MDLEQKAIERIKMAAEMSQNYYEKPLVITTSGGKDSDLCVELARRSGVLFEVQHSHTTADAIMSDSNSKGWKGRELRVRSITPPIKINE